MKKLSLLWAILLFILPVLGSALATQASLNGSSGIISVPSADTVPARSLLLGSWILLDEPTSYAPRVLLSFIPRWELGAGVDIDENAENSYILNTKYKIYDSDLDIAVGFNYQINGGPKDSDMNQENSQFYLAFTWAGYGKTSAFIGKTFGDNTEKDEIDFGIGFEKDMWGGSFGGLALIFDFSNDNYRRMAGPMTGVGDSRRGIFNLGLRIKALENKLNIDFISVDLLDEARSWGASLAYRLSF